MVILKDRELAHRFQAGLVPPSEALIYFMIKTLIIFMGASVVLKAYSPPMALSPYSYVIDMVNLLFIIFGTLYCFRLNNKGDDKDFIERMVCLGFPVFIQSFIVVTLLSTILTFAGLFNHMDINAPDLPDTIVGTVGVAYYYGRMIGAIKIASGLRKQEG